MGITTIAMTRGAKTMSVMAEIRVTQPWSPALDSGVSAQTGWCCNREEQ